MEEIERGLGSAVMTFLVSFALGAIAFALVLPNSSCSCASRSSRERRAADRAEIARALADEALRGR